MPRKKLQVIAELPDPQSAEAHHNKAKERILEAALAEFSLGGFAGARVGNIAHRANVSQQLLFHYFGSKRGLQEAAIEHFMTSRAEPKVRGDFSNLAQRMQMNYEHVLEDHEATRLLIWESLELEETDTKEDLRRTELFRALVDSFAEKQSDGALPATIEPELLVMTVLGLAMLPQVLPMYLRSVFGVTPTDPNFIAKWKKYLGQLGELIAPSAPSKTASRAPRRRAPKGTHS